MTMIMFLVLNWRIVIGAIGLVMIFVGVCQYDDAKFNFMRKPKQVMSPRDPARVAREKSALKILIGGACVAILGFVLHLLRYPL